MTRPPLVVAVPNISEGRRPGLVREIAGSDQALLDVHIDPDHNRSVLTLAAPRRELAAACIAVFDRAVDALDIRDHDGAHPRFGVADVFPFVPYTASKQDALKIADELGRHAEARGIPVVLYGDTVTLPDVRRRLRNTHTEQHPTAGFVCIGVREPLVAFNVNIRGTIEDARRIATGVRQLPGVRALGFELPSRGLVQVSMNLTQPDTTGPKRAYNWIAEAAAETIEDAEIVGLAPESVKAQLTGIPLRVPARSIDDAINDRWQ